MKEELYMQNAMIIDPKDNVAVAIEPIAARGYRYLSQRGKDCISESHGRYYHLS